MRIILDTNILISSLVFDNQMEGLLKYLINDVSVSIITSNALWEEVNSKFCSGKIERISQRSKRIITPVIISTFLSKMKKNSTFIPTHTIVTKCRDPKDNMILELAYDSNAHYIVTGDKDLLVLNPFYETNIVTASEFINQIEKLTLHL